MIFGGLSGFILNGKLVGFFPLVVVGIWEGGGGGGLRGGRGWEGAGVIREEGKGRGGGSR